MLKEARVMAATDAVRRRKFCMGERGWLVVFDDGNRGRTGFSCPNLPQNTKSMEASNDFARKVLVRWSFGGL
jgi:hypothetical protein